MTSPNRFNVLALALLGSLSSPLFAAAPIAEATAPLDPRGTLEASNVRGRISVTAWDRNEVSWSGALGAGAKLVVEKSATRVSISVESEEGGNWLGWNNGPREDSVLVIKVPASAALDLSAVSANIDVTAMRGSPSIEAESVSGEVSLRASSADKLEISSVSGDVSFEGQAGRVDAETVSGDVRVSGVSGDVSVETVSGSAIVRGASVNEFEAASVSGDIDFEGTLAADGRMDVESMSGDVSITLPADASARVSAESFSGDLENDFGLVVEDDDGPGSTLHGTLGAGGASIEIESFSGDVNLRKR
ncbi:MAG TPA: DUF4097 family beta strand repeat-containing protein [Patescibacteria group bacterium]|nr:DUF4097 family beta strand repeat-containing protein [Patescibacteria group bacterium]